MTRDEAIEFGNLWLDVNEKYRDSVTVQFFRLSVKALEQEPKTGTWLNWTDDRKDYLKCSICGYGEEGEVKFGEYTPYCPMCGAKMVESEG